MIYDLRFWMETGRLVTFDCMINNTVKVQKNMKNIVKIIHLPSVVQSELNEATRTLFLRKENKYYDFIQQFVSSTSP